MKSVSTLCLERWVMRREREGALTPTQAWLHRNLEHIAISGLDIIKPNFAFTQSPVLSLARSWRKKGAGIEHSLILLHLSSLEIN